MRSRIVFAFLAASIAAAPASAALTSAEQAMIRTIDAEQQRTTAMLQRWVDQNSGTLNLAGVRAVRDMVEPEFRQLGFKTEWIEMKAAGRAGHLVARHVGSSSGKRLLLIATPSLSRTHRSSAGPVKGTWPMAQAPATTRAGSR
jgi:glutamate carboxypeptidase